MTLKKNILIISGAAIAVLMVGLSGFLLNRGIAQLAETETKLAESKSTLVDLHKKDPFPSKKNIDDEKANVEGLQKSFGKLMTDLRAGEVQPIANITPSTFMTLLYSKRNELINKAKQSGTTLPANFAFGFDRYCAADSRLPPPAELPLLSQQLVVIENLGDILLREKVKEIIKIAKDDSEIQAGAASASVDKKELFTKLHFVVEFKAKEGSLLDVLNSISSSKMFMAVSSIKVEKEGPDVLDVARATLGDDEAAKPSDLALMGTGAVARAAAMALSREERTVSGVRMEKMMKVTLTVDAYKFRAE
jgi:hypothetical protein